MGKPLPFFIRLWFVADALLPPLHWAAGGAAPVLGVPGTLVYLFATSAFISASVVAAYLVDGGRI